MIKIVIFLFQVILSVCFSLGSVLIFELLISNSYCILFNNFEIKFEGKIPKININVTFIMYIRI
jgi:hypothetical protein